MHRRQCAVRKKIPRDIIRANVTYPHKQKLGQLSGSLKVLHSFIDWRRARKTILGRFDRPTSDAKYLYPSSSELISFPHIHTLFVFSVPGISPSPASCVPDTSSERLLELLYVCLVVRVEHDSNSPPPAACTRNNNNKKKQQQHHHYHHYVHGRVSTSCRSSIGNGGTGNGESVGGASDTDRGASTGAGRSRRTRRGGNGSRCGGFGRTRGSHECRGFARRW